MDYITEYLLDNRQPKDTRAALTQIAYESNLDKREKDAAKLGYKLDRNNSDEYVSTYTKDGKNAIVAIRGTKLTDKSDLQTNLKTALRSKDIGKNDRYSETLDKTKKIQAKYKNVEIAGHSLGSGIAQYINQETGLPTTTYANPITTKGLFRTRDNLRTYNTKGDLITGSYIPGKNPLLAHSLNSF